MVFDAVLRFRVVRPERSKQGALASLFGDKHSAVPGKQQRLLTLAELPSWVDANPFILSGYRPESRSYWKSLASWTYLHNESCNIYSHLIPAVLLLLSQSFLYHHIRGWNPALTDFDWSILSLQLFTGTVCMLTSVFYHTLLNHSAPVVHRWLQFDYIGIITLILGNFISGLHFGFYCHPSLKFFYWSLIITLGSATAFALLSPSFRGPEWRSFRLGSFICTGLSAFAPIGHGFIRWGPGYVQEIGVPYYLLEGLLLLIGCFFWERRIPERISPGKFDIFGHSHTIWHVFVALSIGAHILGLISALDYSYNRSLCRPV